eukprot:CAMPEP_0174368002 /NCGR_PEP_ID=MMETSP0811_2-20130205/87442_1 /TAXON_ID=73025 ORGANISM="Eutreptiella gymnastica-like, Strain CCMP1594" /NCGR_SAMPLE_ID=MMETSP0811_2 /ASSEMBLY_ACC=CAM_ASM_000667 /LENGTH=57 /DNA_ID=CAMNT_0015511115 /DNA_START=432 /DNA_END=605 /DNA_ORIENTATION=+
MQRYADANNIMHFTEALMRPWPKGGVLGAGRSVAANTQQRTPTGREGGEGGFSALDH